MVKSVDSGGTLIASQSSQSGGDITSNENGMSIEVIIIPLDEAPPSIPLVNPHVGSVQAALGECAEIGGSWVCGWVVV
jgi:hypothetical protein